MELFQTDTAHTIGLLSTLSMSVFERQREIGVMRSIGASSFTIASQFLTEGMLVGMLAWIVSVPLSYLIALWLIGTLPFGADEVGYAPIALLVGLIGLVVGWRLRRTPGHLLRTWLATETLL